MSKAMVLGVLLLVVLGALGGVYYYVTKSPIRTAFLNVEDTQVQVDQGAGYQTATDNMDLSLNDKVKTLDGRASIVLRESIIVALDPQSEVQIKDLDKAHVKIAHTLGSAWHKFTGLTGIDTFSVETPTTVATVRGTLFQTTMEGVKVLEGEVEVVTKDGKKYILKPGQKIEEKDGEWVTSPLTSEETKSALDEMREMIERLKNLRWDEIEKKSTLLNWVKKRYSMNDTVVQERLDQADQGQVNLTDVESKSPIQTEVVSRVRGFTEEIVETNKAIAFLEQ